MEAAPAERVGGRLSPFAAGLFAFPAARAQFQLGTASPNDVAVQMTTSSPPSSLPLRIWSRHKESVARG